MINKIATIFGILATLSGGWFFVDNRFAQAEELKELKIQTMKIEQHGIQTLQDFRIQMIADELNDLGAKEEIAPNGLSKWDKVRRERLMRQWEVLIK
jgi:anaerobic glycerol-3-phosphate dehydrogenase